MKVAIFTDQGAHYRYPVLNAISKNKPDGCLVDFYIPINDAKGLHLVEAKDWNNMQVKQIINYSYRGRLIYQGKVATSILSNRYDVVVIWGIATVLSNWLAVLAACWKKSRVIFWGHGLYGNEGKLKRYLRLGFYRMADMQLLYGKHAQSLLARHLPNVKTEVIYNSLDVKRIRLLHKLTRARNLDLKWDLIFVGRLTPLKRLDLLMDALVELKKKEICPRVLVVGDGAIGTQLVDCASRLNIGSSLEWGGSCYDEAKLSEYFAQSRFCVSPGNIGLMAMHSLYNETPVITHSDLNEQMPEAEIIRDGVNGFLFNRDDPQSLAKAILRSMECDYRQLSERCFSSVYDYRPERQSLIFWEAVRFVKRIAKK